MISNVSGEIEIAESASLEFSGKELQTLNQKKNPRSTFWNMNCEWASSIVIGKDRSRRLQHSRDMGTGLRLLLSSSKVSRFEAKIADPFFARFSCIHFSYA